MPSRLRGGAAKRRLVVLLVVVLALGIFAPTLVLHSPLRQSLLTRLVPAEVGSVSAKSITAGWFTPVSATGVSLFDHQGNRLADIQRVSLTKSITGLLGDSQNLGTIRIEQPVVYALARPDGSNIEDTLALATQSQTEPPEGQLAVATSGPNYQLEVVGGTVLSRDAATGETWAAESIEAVVAHPSDGPLRVDAKGLVRLVPADNAAPMMPQQQAKTDGRFEVRWGANDTGKAQGVRLVCQTLPLAACEPWLKRADPQLQLTGTLSGELNLAYPTAKYDSLSGDSSGRVSLTGFGVNATALSGKPFTLEQTNLAWKGVASGGQVSIENLSLASDVAMFDVRGTLDERAVRAVAAGQVEPLALTTAGDIEAEGKLHLARLAERLPTLLQIRQGTTITAGQMQFEAKSVPQGGGHQLTASLRTTPLTGVADGRQITWDAPLDINLVARRTGADLRFDRLTCQSEFLQFTGSGDARRMELEGNVNLDELTSRLDQFVDLTDWQLAGRGELKATCSRDQTGQLAANGAGSLSDFVIAYRGDQLASEPKLNWSANFAGAAPQGTLWPNQLTRGEVTLTAAGDKLRLELTQPTLVQASWQTTDWPLLVATDGKLETWATRLRPWADFSEWQLRGLLDLDARGRFRAAPLQLNIAESGLDITRLQAATNDLQIDEPRVKWTGDITWDGATGTLTSGGGQLVSSTLAASFRDWFWTADPQQTHRVGGLAAVRMNLGRIAQMQLKPSPTGQPSQSLQPIGEVSGNVKLAAQGGQVVAAIDLTGTNIRLEKPAPVLPGQPPAMQTVWQEPNLRLVGTVSYLPQVDQLKFDGLQTQAATIALAASGSIHQVSTTPEVDLAGTIDYDLASLTPIIAQYVGEGLTIVGREQARFELKGALTQTQLTTTTLAGPLRGPGSTTSTTSTTPAAPLGTNIPGQLTSATATGGTPPSSSPSDWYARVLAPWQSASLYGLPVGQGRISAELKAGQIVVEPLDVAIGGGRLTASPRIQLDPAPGELTLPAGPVLSNIAITTDVSERMLKFIAPVVAGATRSEGLFSMNLSSARIPLGDATRADVAGQLAVQSVKVTPGPMVAEWISIARQLETLVKSRDLASLGSSVTGGSPVTLVSISDRTVDFRLVDGRVYHQGLEFQIGDLMVRSRGSVGLDNSLSLMLEFHVPAKWLGRRAENATGTVIEVPVTGTFSKWNVDRRAVLDSVKQRGLEAAGELLGDEINGALEKLFRSGR